MTTSENKLTRRLTSIEERLDVNNSSPELLELVSELRAKLSARFDAQIEAVGVRKRAPISLERLREIAGVKQSEKPHSSLAGHPVREFSLLARELARLNQQSDIEDSLLEDPAILSLVNDIEGKLGTVIGQKARGPVDLNTLRDSFGQKE